jgi:hypothetical protein
VDRSLCQRREKAMQEAEPHERGWKGRAGAAGDPVRADLDRERGAAVHSA